MSDAIFKAIESAAPVVITAIAVYWPQYIASMRQRGGWWAVGGTALMVVGHIVYRAYS